MSDDDFSADDPLGRIVDEFMEAIRRGERPSVEQFAQRYPEHADDIRDILPALGLTEQAKSAEDSTDQRRQADAAGAASHLTANAMSSCALRSETPS